jgi:type IV pilus assembly protein PilA
MSSFIAKLQKRLAQEESGFTLIELLIVLVIIGILLAIAVPSYLGFKDRANKAAAQANVRSAIPSAEAYYSDNGSYASMNINSGAAPNTGGLKGIDQGIKLDKVTVLNNGAGYTLCAVSGNYYATVTGPGGTITVASGTACP